MIDQAQVLRADLAHVWHPYSPLVGRPPLVVARAEGPRLHLADGRALYDANASWWVSALGHGHPRLKAALRAQLDALDHCALAGLTHEPAALLAEELCRRTPGMTRLFFTDNGSTAVECAAKLTLQHHAQTGKPGKRRFLALEGAYHGDTIGASSLGGVELFKRPFGSVLFDCLRVAPGDHAAAFDALERVIVDARHDLAAVVIEPLVQGANGMTMYGPPFLSRLRELTRAHDVTFIADEVFTGYGRTGTFWACEQAGVVPDLVCTAKGFSGGTLPMGAVLISEAMTRGFEGERGTAFMYGHSFCGNPLGAALAREVLRVYDDELVMEGIAERAAMIRAAFGRIGEATGSPWRALGMIGAVDLGRDGYLGGVGWKVYDEALALGAYLRPLGDTVYVTPPLNIPTADLGALLGIVEEAVRRALA